MEDFFSNLITTPKVDNVTLHRQLKESIHGRLCLTFSHLIVSSFQKNEESDEQAEEFVNFI
jgi:hypothetical protein